MARIKSTIKTDRCRPIKEHISRVEKEIADIEGDLGEPDIPAALKAKLRELLKRLRLLRVQLTRALATCQALPHRPPRA